MNRMITAILVLLVACLVIFSIFTALTFSTLSNVTVSTAENAAFLLDWVALGMLLISVVLLSIELGRSQKT